MKKVLWLIVCLMTMVMSFTSCSSNDENENSTKNYSYLNGEWIDAEGTTFIIHDGWIDVMNATSSAVVGRVRFEIENNTTITYTIDGNEYTKDIEYYKEKIAIIEEELKTARGDRRQRLIDELNEYISRLRKVNSYQESGKRYYGTIYKMTPTEFEFGIDYTDAKGNTRHRLNLKRK